MNVNTYTKDENEFVRPTYHIVLDLEMCRVSGKSEFGHSHEIIQIGAVMVSDTFEVVSEFSTYVHPEYGKIDRFITKLTGIEEKNTASAPQLKDALNMFFDWSSHFRPMQIYAWSENDYNQLSCELDFKNIQNKQIREFMDRTRWVDYQNVFDKKFGYGRSVSLEDALMYSEIYPVGRAHNGLDDALNTALIIEKIENNPDYKPCVKGAENVKENQLTYSMGNLLGQFFSQTNFAAG